MPSSPVLKYFFSACIAIILWQPLMATAITSYDEADKTISQLYHSQILKPTSNISARIAYFSAQFLELPYLLGALGEGFHAKYDQYPLYRTDAFDCETYVDTVIALARAHDLNEFKHEIRQVRYKDGHVSFVNRNHFTCLDWNQNNQRAGLVKDITTTFHDKQGQHVAQIAQAIIDKPRWYQNFPSTRVRINNASKALRAQRLVELKQEGHHLSRTTSTTPYIPLSALFNQAGEPNQHLFDQIPSGAIIEIVRPNWDLEQQIGTRLNVSHLGFAIRENGKLMFRAATSINQRILDVSLISYLRETLKSPTIKGINIQIVCAQCYKTRSTHLLHTQS